MKAQPIILHIVAIWLGVIVGALAKSVCIEICEQGLFDKDEWPVVPPVASETFEIPAFALAELPPKYEHNGIRGARPSPSLLRMSGEVQAPAGRHRVLIRSRTAARL